MINLFLYKHKHNDSLFMFVIFIIYPYEISSSIIRFFNFLILAYYWIMKIKILKKEYLNYYYSYYQDLFRTTDS